MTTLSIGILPFQVSFLSFNPKAKGRGHYYLIFKTSAKDKSCIKPNINADKGLLLKIKNTNQPDFA
jgi:hypothetical protein